MITGLLVRTAGVSDPMAVRGARFASKLSAKGPKVHPKAELSPFLPTRPASRDHRRRDPGPFAVPLAVLLCRTSLGSARRLGYGQWSIINFESMMVTGGLRDL